MEAFYSKKIEGLNDYIISTDTSPMDDGVSPRSYMINRKITNQIQMQGRFTNHKKI